MGEEYGAVTEFRSIIRAAKLGSRLWAQNIFN
jgi:hypothetical protein